MTGVRLLSLSSNGRCAVPGYGVRFRHPLALERATMALSALIFDFDGLVVDTESASYQAWCEEFGAAGAELALERWLEVVGTHDADFDPVEELARLAAEPVDRMSVTHRQRDRFVELVHRQPCRPGVEALIQEAVTQGVTVAAASSSPTSWVEEGLGRRGLAELFDLVAGRDRVGGRAKPAPDVYEFVLREIGCAPQEALAIEDSVHGITAALGAGLTVIAVPNQITQVMDLTSGHATFDTLRGVRLAELELLLDGAR